jgi:hypothetical protein
MALAATQLSRSGSRLVQVHGAVCEKDGYKLFQDVTLNGGWTGWSGFRDTFDQHHAHQVHRMLLLSPGMLSLSQLLQRKCGGCTDTNTSVTYNRW